MTGIDDFQYEILSAIETQESAREADIMEELADYDGREIGFGELLAGVDNLVNRDYLRVSDEDPAVYATTDDARELLEQRGDL